MKNYKYNTRKFFFFWNFRNSQNYWNFKKINMKQQSDPNDAPCHMWMKKLTSIFFQVFVGIAEIINSNQIKFCGWKSYFKFFSNIILVEQKSSNQTKSNSVDEKAYFKFFSNICVMTKIYQIKFNCFKKILQIFSNIFWRTDIIKSNQIKFCGWRRLVQIFFKYICDDKNLSNQI